MRILLLILFAMPVAAGEPFRIGAALKFGFPFTGWFANVVGRESADDRSRSWMIGAAIEFRQTKRLAIEASGVYRPIGRDAGGGYLLGFSDRERGYLWEFPVAAKYRFRHRLKTFQPFVVAGPSSQWLHTHTDSDFSILIGDPQGNPVFMRQFSRFRTRELTGGITAGAGVERRFGRVMLFCEGRYTRRLAGSRSGNTLRSGEVNQATFLLGIGF